MLSMFFFLLNGFSLKKFNEMPMMNEKNNYAFLNLYANSKNDPPYEKFRERRQKNIHQILKYRTEASICSILTIESALKS